MGPSHPMSRPPRGRHPTIGNRLSNSLDGQLADIASTIGALDLDASPPDGAPAGEASGSDDPGPEDPTRVIGEPAAPASLDGMLDEFEVAMGAMLDARARTPPPRPADGPPMADEDD